MPEDLLIMVQILYALRIINYFFVSFMMAVSVILLIRIIMQLHFFWDLRDFFQEILFSVQNDLDLIIFVRYFQYDTCYVSDSNTIKH